jgi:hypothetical protein
MKIINKINLKKTFSTLTLAFFLLSSGLAVISAGAYSSLNGRAETTVNKGITVDEDASAVIIRGSELKFTDEASAAPIYSLTSVPLKGMLYKNKKL